MTEITIPRQVGQVVRAARKARGMSQAQLALDARISRQLVNRLEMGEATNISLGRLLDVLDVLGCTMSIDWDGDGDEDIITGNSAGYVAFIENGQYNERWRDVHMFPEETARLIRETKANGGRVIAIGTTSCRTLESVATEYGEIKPCEGFTDIFIYPGYEFKVLDGLVTNFHLPESTLIMLVSAFAGYDNVMNAYQIAVKEKYRFFSFGDACFFY